MILTKWRLKKLIYSTLTLTILKVTPKKEAMMKGKRSEVRRRKLLEMYELHLFLFIFATTNCQLNYCNQKFYLFLVGEVQE